MPPFDWADFISRFGFPVALVIFLCLFLAFLVWPWWRKDVWPLIDALIRGFLTRADHDREVYVNTIAAITADSKAEREKSAAELRVLWENVAKSDNERVLGRQSYLASMSEITTAIQSGNTQTAKLMGEMVESIRELHGSQEHVLSLLSHLVGGQPNGPAAP